MRGILLAKLISEEAPPATPPPAPQAPAAPTAPTAPAAPDQSQVAPADSLVQKDFNAFKSELKGLEDQKTSVIQKWEGAIKKKVGGKKVKVLASKAQHFQPSSEYTIDVSDVKIGWHYDKTTGEIVYDLILIDGDKKYFMKPSQQQALPQGGAPGQEPETTEAPKTPEAPPPAPEPSADQPSPDAGAGVEAPPEGGAEPDPAAAPAPAGGDPTAEPAVSPQEPSPEELPPKKKKVAPQLELSRIRESSVLNDESYAIEEIINDIKSIVQEVTGRSNLKPYLLGAGKKSGGRVTFELSIPKNHLRENVSTDDVELSFRVNNMKARVDEDFRGRNIKVRVIKEVQSKSAIVLPEEKFSEVWYNVLKKGKPIDDEGGYQFGDWAIQGYSRDGLEEFGQLFYKGTPVQTDGPGPDSPPGT